MLQGAAIPLLFEISRQGSSGKVRLGDGRRTVTLAVRRRNVVGIKGMPELWDRLQSPTVDTSQLGGHLMQDIPRLMAAGVGIDRIFEEAVFGLGRYLADLVEGDEVATFREVPEPDTAAVGLPRPLMAIVVEALRTFREPRMVQRDLAVDNERKLKTGRVAPELISPWSPEAAQLLVQAKDFGSLDAWLVKIDRAPRGRRDQFWRALDLLIQTGALELEGSKRTPLGVRRVRPEDEDSATPSGFSTFSVAPNVPAFMLDLGTEGDGEAEPRKPSWQRSETVTLGTPEVFELPPDPDSDSVYEEDEAEVVGPLVGSGLDDHDDVFALPPDEDEDDEDDEDEPAPVGTGLDDHDDVFALPPDDEDDDEDDPSGSPSVVSFAAKDEDLVETDLEPVVTTIIDEDSQHVVRPLFTPRKRKKKT